MNLKPSFIASRSSIDRYTNAQIRQTLSGELLAGLSPEQLTSVVRLECISKLPEL